jgi:hypothetical protein
MAIFMSLNKSANWGGIFSISEAGINSVRGLLGWLNDPFHVPAKLSSARTGLHVSFSSSVSVGQPSKNIPAASTASSITQNPFFFNIIFLFSLAARFQSPSTRPAALRTDCGLAVRVHKASVLWTDSGFTLKFVKPSKDIYDGGMETAVPVNFGLYGVQLFMRKARPVAERRTIHNAAASSTVVLPVLFLPAYIH